MGALDRFNYTMMGDMVNLAARCESGAKAYGAYIMVTEETKLDSEKTKDDIAFRYLDKIVVKGRSQPVAMFEPTGFMSKLDQETQIGSIVFGKELINTCCKIGMVPSLCLKKQRILNLISLVLHLA